MPLTQDKQDLVRQLLLAIGEDPEREGLKGTPDRVVRSWAELYGGYAEDPKEILSTQFLAPKSRMVLINGIDFRSTCEHHMMPFGGQVDIAYWPKDHVVGLSKFARLVNCFARRLQIQENMTDQIADAICTYVDSSGVAVRVQAIHTCMSARGAMSRGKMVTFALRGIVEDNEALLAQWQASLPPC